MDDILNRPIVLVLNRNWQAINVRTPQHAFVQMATDVATALDIDGETMVPARWAEWIKLPVRENDYAVRTPSGPIRVPAVIVLSRFAKVPKRRPKFSARAIWARDGGQCQYTGANLRPSEGNIDHVLPRSRGGKTSWENCVLASKDVNSRKADRLPEEVGLRLLKSPTAPKELPSTLFIRNVNGIAAWKHFLVE
jgi:5-methylcytosine-specific restriction endonuclease McrA